MPIPDDSPTFRKKNSILQKVDVSRARRIQPTSFPEPEAQPQPEATTEGTTQEATDEQEVELPATQPFPEEEDGPEPTQRGGGASKQMDNPVPK